MLMIQVSKICWISKPQNNYEITHLSLRNKVIHKFDFMQNLNKISST